MSRLWATRPDGCPDDLVWAMLAVLGWLVLLVGVRLALGEACPR